jgi:O-antigen ligase
MASKADTARRDAAGRTLASRACTHGLPGLIGIAPVLTMLLSWAGPGAEISGWQAIVKAFALPVVAVELAIIATAMARSGKWAPSALPRRYLAAAAALLLLALTTAFAAASPATAVVRTGLWIVHCAFAWSIYLLCTRSWLDPTKVVSALLAGFGISCLLLILFISQIEDPARFKWVNGLPGFDNIRRGAYFAAPIAGLCLGRFSSAPGRSRAFSATIYMLAIAFIFWSGARGAVFAIAAAFAIGAAILPQLRSMKGTIIMLAASATGICLAWVYSFKTGFSGFRRMFMGADGEAFQPNSDLTSGRADLWISTWQTILQRPLFGHGEGQTGYVVPLGQEMDIFHPHNLVLQVLLAWGVMGALLLLYLALPIARAALENARARKECVPPFAAMLVILLYSAIDGTLFHVHAVALFAACVGMIALSDPANSARPVR